MNTIVFVKDIERSKQFYTDVLEIPVEEDLGIIVFFKNRLVLHAADKLSRTVFKREKLSSRFRQGRNNVLIYLETDDLEASFQKIAAHGVKMIHAIEKQAWGQRVFRFFDPDKHIVEIGEPQEDTASTDA